MRRKISLILFVFLFSITPSLGSSQGFEIHRAFSLNLLSPNTSAARYQWSLLMEQQLPKIGIGINFHESTELSNIAPRTWDYPLIDFDYIPTYAEGGFDILVNDETWDLNWDPSGRFDSSSLLPNGRNIYQYSNPIYDDLLDSYISTLDEIEREDYAHQIQQILYEDLPTICLIYPRSLFGARESVSNVDFLLLSIANPRVEFWENLPENIIKYVIPVELTDPNIFVSNSFYDKVWMNSVYGSLFKQQQDTHNWESIIAKNYTISSNGLNFRIDLDTNAKFSDNSSVLAEDVVYSYALHLDPDVGSYRYTSLKNFFPNGTSIEVIDSDTIEFHFNSYCAFPFSFLSIGIIDKSTIEPLLSMYGYEIFNEIPLTGNVNDSLVKSCGPFILNDYNSSISIVKLVPNQYWNNLTTIEENAKLESFYIQYISGKDEAVAELIAGNVDIIECQYFPELPDFEGITGIEGVLVKTPRYEELAVNLKHPVIGTGELTPIGTAEAAKDIRHAISHAVPRQVIIDEILEGLGFPGVTPVTDFFSCFDESLKPYVYDLDLALDYMEEAGYDVIQYPYTNPYSYGKIFRNSALIILSAGVLAVGMILTVNKIGRKNKPPLMR